MQALTRNKYAVLFLFWIARGAIFSWSVGGVCWLKETIASFKHANKAGGIRLAQLATRFRTGSRHPSISAARLPCCRVLVHLSNKPAVRRGRDRCWCGWVAAVDSPRTKITTICTHCSTPSSEIVKGVDRIMPCRLKLQQP